MDRLFNPAEQMVHSAIPGPLAPAAQSVAEGAAEQDADGLAQRLGVGDRLAKWEPDVMVASIILGPQRDSVAVNGEWADPATAQCGRGVPQRELVDNLRVIAIEMFQPVGFDFPERIRAGEPQMVWTDALSASSAACGCSVATSAASSRSC